MLVLHLSQSRLEDVRIHSHKARERRQLLHEFDCAVEVLDELAAWHEIRVARTQPGDVGGRDNFHVPELAAANSQ